MTSSVTLAVYEATRESLLTGDLRKLVLDMALANKSSLLSDTSFLHALWTQFDLQEFAVDLLTGIDALHEHQFHAKQKEHKMALQASKAESEKQRKSYEASASTLLRAEQEKVAEAEALLEAARAMHDTAIASEKEKLEQVEAKLQKGRAGALAFKADVQKATEEARNQHKAATDALRADLTAQQRLLQDAEASKVTAEQRPETANKVIEQLKQLNRISRCRHCRRSFEYHLERHGPNGYLARCFWEDCMCKHYAGGSI